ncbi:hypothetical protein CDD83_8139 [Cordyceps sp. RAO-2017]|nr:hypothetical protein CDD83_8139 [Cordyceps sp. RAO-2017]
MAAANARVHLPRHRGTNLRCLRAELTQCRAAPVAEASHLDYRGLLEATAEYLRYVPRIPGWVRRGKALLVMLDSVCPPPLLQPRRSRARGHAAGGAAAHVHDTAGLYAARRTLPSPSPLSLSSIRCSGLEALRQQTKKRARLTRAAVAFAMVRVLPRAAARGPRARRRRGDDAQRPQRQP